LAIVDKVRHKILSPIS
jgi:hypothetical protein